jgi:hypothetical protein
MEYKVTEISILKPLNPWPRPAWQGFGMESQVHGMRKHFHSHMPSRQGGLEP